LPPSPTNPPKRSIARVKHINASAAAQHHSKICTVSDAVEEREKDQAADKKTHNGDGGDNGGRNGLRRTGHRPGRRRDRSGPKERRRPFYQILGELGDRVPVRDGAAVDRQALQEGDRLWRPAGTTGALLSELAAAAALKPSH